MSDGDLISELYAGCFRRLVVQFYAVSGDINDAQEAVQEAFAGALVAALQRGAADHVMVTRDGSSWTRFDLPR